MLMCFRSMFNNREALFNRREEDEAEAGENGESWLKCTKSDENDTNKHVLKKKKATKTKKHWWANGQDR